MSGGVTTTTQVDDAVQKFVAKALEAREHEGVMDKLTDTKTLPRKMGGTYYEPYFNSLVSQQLTDNVPLSSAQQLLDGQITISPNEFGLMVAISHWSNDIVDPDLFGVAGRLMSRANEYKRDTTGLVMLDGFSNSGGNSGANALVANHITGASTAIRGGRLSNRSNGRATGDPPTGPIVAVLHDYQWYDLAAQLSGTSNLGAITTVRPAFNYTTSNGISPYQVQWLEQHFMGQLHGTKLFIDNNLTISGSGTSAMTKSGVFAKDALINLKFRGLMKNEDKSVDGRVTYLTLVDNWGWGERNDGWGYELNTLCVQPLANTAL